VRIRADMQWYMIGSSFFSFLLLSSIVFYFPSKPPTPSSASASTPRIDYKNGIKTLIKNKNAWLATLAYAIPNGLGSAWSATSTIVLNDIGLDDTEAGYLGLAGTIGSAGTALMAAFLADLRFRRKMRAIVALLSTLSAVMALWMALIVNQYLPLIRWQLWLTFVTSASSTFAAAPLLFEYSSELTFPVPEGVVGAYMSVLNNVFCFILLCIFFLPFKSFAWMTYALVAAYATPVPLVLATKDTYRRANVDEGQQEQEEETDTN